MLIIDLLARHYRDQRKSRKLDNGFSRNSFELENSKQEEPKSRTQQARPSKADETRPFVPIGRTQINHPALLPLSNTLERTHLSIEPALSFKIGKIIRSAARKAAPRVEVRQSMMVKLQMLLLSSREPLIHGRLYSVMANWPAQAKTRPQQQQLILFACPSPSLQAVAPNQMLRFLLETRQMNGRLETAATPSRMLAHDHRLCDWSANVRARVRSCLSGQSRR